MMIMTCFANNVLFVGRFVTTTILLLSVAISSNAFSLQSTSSSPPKKVLVTGAAGKTGRLVLQKLLQADPARFDPKAIVRTEQSAVKLLHDLPQLSLEQVVVSDITDPRFCEDFPMQHKMDAMIICTSAVPRIRKRSLAKALVQIPWRWIRRQRPWINPRQLHFCWKYQGYPELVDYHGQLAQIQLAQQDHLDISQVIVVSSMGVTKEDKYFLNQVGKGPDGSGHGDILKWKRRAEEYLMQVCV